MIQSAKRQTVLICGAVLLALGALLSYGWLQSYLAPECHLKILSSSVPLPDELPLSLPQNSSAKVKLTIIAAPHAIRSIRLMQDDCIDSLIINDVALPGLDEPYCNFALGLPIDETLLQPGHNELIVGVRNNGGPGGLSIAPNEQFLPYTIAKIILILAFCPMLFCAAKAIQAGTFLSPLFFLVTNRVLFPLLIIIAVALRIWWFPFGSTDIYNFLAPWLAFLRQNGFTALGQNFSDYSPPYLYLLALISYLPSSIPLPIAIKIPSLIIDLLLAYSVFRLTFIVTKRKECAAPTAIAILFAPTVWMNSAVWGQCDGLVALLIVLSLEALLRAQPTRAILWYGVALATKLQAIFIFPLFLWLNLRGRFALRLLLWIPIVYIAAILPTWIIGRPLSDLFGIYFHQSRSYPNLTLGAPSFYALLNAESAYTLLFPTGIVLCAVSIVFLLRLARQKNGVVTTSELLQIAFLFALLVPYLLPKMHERYFFTADILAFPLAASDRRYFHLPFVMQLCSGLSYLPYLFGATTLSLPFLAFVLGTVLIWMLREVAFPPSNDHIR